MDRRLRPRALTRPLPLAVLTATLLACAFPAAAILRENTGLEVIANVDLDGRLRPGAPLAAETEREVSVPFPRSVVAVADQAPGVFEYFAEADIGLQTLKLFGTLSNTTTAEFIGDGLPILNVFAQIRDVLTLATALPGKQIVTLSLDIDGLISNDPTNTLPPRANASLFFGPAGSTPNFDLNSYVGNASGSLVIDDSLSVAIEIEGPLTQVEIDAQLAFSIFRLLPGETAAGALHNTAFLRLSLPAGVTLASSNSGTFGEVIPAPVPLPATLLPLTAACVTLVARRRRSLGR